MTTSGNLLQNYFSRLYIPRITWTDIIEIIIIAVVLYNILLWIMNTKAWALLKGIIVVGLFAVVAYLLNLKTILWIAGKTISVGIIALVIIFHPVARINNFVSCLNTKTLIFIAVITKIQEIKNKFLPS